MSTETDSFAAAGVALATALAASANDPADAIRMLLPLAGWMPPPVTGTSQVAAQNQAALDAIASNLRCAACAALAGATQAYGPVSYQDAMAVRDAVCDALDAEATRAADAGRDATYQALSELRAAVALDLAVRGAGLAWLVEIETRQPMRLDSPKAWTLYQEYAREPGLVASADPPHPLFMPTTFPALNA